VEAVGLRAYLIARSVQSAVTAFLVISFNFFLFRVLPGDPVQLLTREWLFDPESRLALLRLYGLDKPLYMQYFIYIWNIFRGDWGLSFVYRVNVLNLVIERLLNTALLVGPALVLAIVVGVGLGILSASKGGKVDAACLSFSALSWAAPTFWVGMILLMVFSVMLRLFPISGMTTAGVTYASSVDRVLDMVPHMILPLATLMLVLLGEYAFIMRESVMGVLGEDYILTAKAKGASRSRILRRYVLPNSILPIISLIAIRMGLVVAGTIQVETIFGWPGMGLLIFDSLLMRDYPVLQGIFLLVCLVVIFANLVADLLYAYVDPRVKY
jgi:peptide/nickel transport system permease protein